MEIIERKIGNGGAMLRMFLHRDMSALASENVVFPEKRRAVLVIPGGGYNHVSEREAEPVAFSFFAKGYEAAVLYYSVSDDIAFSNPIEEASLALCELRRLESVDPERVLSIGFSAGAHLAAMLAEHGCEFDKDAKLNALILSYPVITMGKETHAGSREMICPTIGNEDYLSAERCVSPSFPPTYIWSTREDETVDVKNSLMMYEALLANGVFSEIHIYPEGKHGLSVATSESGTPDGYVARWLDEAFLFLERVFRSI